MYFRVWQCNRFVKVYFYSSFNGIRFLTASIHFKNCHSHGNERGCWGRALFVKKSLLQDIRGSDHVKIFCLHILLFLGEMVRPF